MRDFGEQQDAGGVAIEPVDQHRPRPVLGRERFEHAVDVALRARAALHREPVGLVQDDDVLVLVERHRPDRLGVGRVGAPLSSGRRGREPERRHAHGLAELEPGRDVGALAGHPHLALADDLVEVGLRQVGKAATEPAVEPHPGLVLANVVEGDLFGCGGGRRFGFGGVAHARVLSQRQRSR